MINIENPLENSCENDTLLLADLQQKAKHDFDTNLLHTYPMAQYSSPYPGVKNVNVVEVTWTRLFRPMGCVCKKFSNEVHEELKNEKYFSMYVM